MHLFILSKQLKHYDIDKDISNAIYNFGNCDINIEEVKPRKTVFNYIINI